MSTAYSRRLKRRASRLTKHNVKIPATPRCEAAENLRTEASSSPQTRKKTPSTQYLHQKSREITLVNTIAQNLLETHRYTKGHIGGGERISAAQPNDEKYIVELMIKPCG